MEKDWNLKKLANTLSLCIQKIDSLWLQVTDETMQGKGTVEIFIDVYIWLHMHAAIGSMRETHAM